MGEELLCAAAERLKHLRFEIGAIRPPSEGGANSLLLRVTRNCPWSRCAFCYGTPYNRERFQLRSVEEIKGEIRSVLAIAEEIEMAEKLLGGLEWVRGMIDSFSLYGKAPTELEGNELKNFGCLVNVFNWLWSGAKTVFLQDADSLIVKTSDLLEVLVFLDRTFPSIERVTSYARSKTLVGKAAGDLRELREAGLSRLHVGLETGDDELLKRVDKGVTAAEHVEGGKKAMEAGLELSEYVMPGLGGESMSEQHAENTSKVLNEINPTYIRFRRFVPRPSTPMFEEYMGGGLKLLTPHGLLGEIGTMIENLEVTSGVCFDHFINPSYRVGGGIVPLFKQDHLGYKFPREKPMVLKLVERGLGIDESKWVSTEELLNMPYL